MKHANVSIFVPHNGCPHQCSFCSQRSITGQQSQPTPEDVRRTLDQAVRDLGERIHESEIAFFGGSFTAIDRRYMISLLDTAYQYVKQYNFTGIRLSTRPDAVDAEVLRLLRDYGATSIELGAQSMDDRILALNGRGHTSRDVEEASALIQEFGFSLGLQMMTGLYGDTPQKSYNTALRLCTLHPDTVRIYPTVVLEGTELASLYRQGIYRPPGPEKSAELCAELLELFERHHIRVIRLGLHASPDLERSAIAGAYHPAFGELCQSRLFLRRLVRAFREHGIPSGSVTVFVSPRDISRAVGQKKANLEALAAQGWQVRFVQIASVPLGGLVFYDPKLEHNILISGEKAG